MALEDPRVECDVTEIVRLHNLGVSVNRIAAQEGVSRSTVTRRLRSRGLSPHSRVKLTGERMRAMTAGARRKVTSAAVEKSKRSRKARYSNRINVRMSPQLRQEIDEARGAETFDQWIREAILRRLRSHRQNAGKAK